MRVDRYILIEWFKVFFLSVFVLFGLLIISDLQDNLPENHFSSPGLLL